MVDGFSIARIRTYLIRINFRADKISRKFAQRRWNARKFIQELRAESRCAKINPRENFQIKRSQSARKFVRAKIYTNKLFKGNKLNERKWVERISVLLPPRCVVPYFPAALVFLTLLPERTRQRTRNEHLKKNSNSAVSGYSRHFRIGNRKRVPCLENFHSSGNILCGILYW